MTRPDAYDPTIRDIVGWSTAGMRLFLVTYQEGAAAETMILLDVERTGAPKIVATRDGALVSVDPETGALNVSYADSGLPDIECMRWNFSKRQLEDVKCRSGSASRR